MAEVLNQSENVEQFERKRHHELDNVDAIVLFLNTMKRMASTLDADKALDVMTYAAILGDPRNPGAIPDWMRELFKKVAAVPGVPQSPESATFSKKVAAITSKGITKQWLLAQKVVTMHPQMRSYTELALRHRFIRGFSQAARCLIHERLTQEMGRRGLAHRAHPLSRSLLMDPAILTASAFHSTLEKENVPAWRDGAAGEALQNRMAEVAADRYFKYDLWQSSDKSLFSSGAAWAAFARLAPHVDNLFEVTFGEPNSWPDTAVCVHRAMWRGDDDLELTRLAQQLPANLDNTPVAMQQHLKDQSLCSGMHGLCTKVVVC